MGSRIDHVSRYRGHDYLWWGLASVLGLWSMWMPQVLRASMDPQSQSYFISGALFLGGVLIGFCRPDRPWRWGMAALVVLPVGDLAWVTHDPSFDVLSLNQILPYVAERGPNYVLQVLPVLVGAYLGSLLVAGVDLS